MRIDVFQLTIKENGEEKCRCHIDSLAWLGREYHGEEKSRLLNPYRTEDPKGNPCLRIPYVIQSDHAVSRWALSMTPLDTNRVRIEAAGKNRYQIDEQSLRPFEPVELSLPIRIRDRHWSFEFEPIVYEFSQDDEVNVLECKPIAPFSKYAAELLEQEESTFASSLEDVAGSSMIAPIQSHLEYGMVDLERMEVSQVLKVLEGTLGIIQSAVTDREFFERAVQMMVNMLELDQGWALTLNKQGEWKVVATVQNPQSTQPIQKEPKESLLRKLQESGQSVWMRLGDQSLTSSEVRIGLSESVGAPVLNPEGKVVGGLCGVKFVDDYYRNSTLFVSRKSRSQTQTEIRAIIMQILAGCVATGIAHLAIKRERDQLDTLLEQYFTRKVSERMKADPTLLRGSECEITSLFCDIRNFSWISAKLEPSVLIEWLQESLSCISECVPKHDGIVVDYIGDELLSIWGDISSESDNAVKAVRAGFAMIHAIDQLSEVWLDRFGGIGFSVGIGVNTGNAFVGNIGTPRKLKFGAIGSSINLASRVQGVTKYFQCPFLVTHQTWRQLNGQFPGRRIGLVSLVNIPEPVDLYQVFPESQTEMRAFCQEYEKALEHFERMEFREAVALAGQLLNRFRDDRPTIILMQRAISCIIDPAVFSKAIVISAK